MNDEENTGNSNDYDEEFILRSVAISYARSRSVNSVADSLSIPADLLEEWRKGYSAKIEVRRLKDKLVTSRHIGWFLLSFKGNTADKGKRERCPKCREKVVFDHIKTFNVQSGAGVDFRPYG
ncbi:MAG: transposase, partial [Clostridiales bacterium]|nr:transposase [Clostridiales bacterium]